MSMRFEYTIHAEENILERKLNKRLIEDAVTKSEKVTISKFGRKVAQKAVRGKLLRVVYEEKESVYIIITAYYTKLGRY